MATLEVGQTAPDFALAATTDERVVLSEVLDRASAAVLLFYRFDFGPIWEDELSQFRDAHARFGELRVRLLAIGTDSIYAHKAFQGERLRAPFPLLSDLSRKVAKAYGVLNPGADSRGFEGAIIRSVFVVDREATIRYRFVSEDPARLPDIEEVLTAARSVVASG